VDNQVETLVKRKPRFWRAYENKILIVLNITLVFVFLILLLYKVSTVPNVFVDEANYANEVVSFARFGTDIHGLHLPIYLSSVWGQGQSILYAIVDAPLVRWFGFSMVTLRVPFLLMNWLILCLLIFKVYQWSKSLRLTTMVNIALISSPWIFISSRWILDANIAPLMFMLATILFASGAMSKSKLLRIIDVLFGALFLSLTAYGYVAAWLYLPVVCVLYFIAFVKDDSFKIWEYIVSVAVILLVAVPIIVFAYRVNILKLTHATKFLFFDIPPLPANRVGSLINLRGPGLINRCMHNLVDGLLIYLGGNDYLQWNSVSPFGAVAPWLLIFAPVGMLGNLETMPKAIQLFRRLLTLNIVAFIPLALVVTPNYNHWNLLNIPLAILVGLGLFLCIQRFRETSIRLLFVLVPICTFAYFLPFGYFGVGTEGSFFENGLVRFRDVQKLNQTVTSSSDSSRLYVDSLSWKFMYFRMVQAPISHSTYLNRTGTKSDFSKKMGDFSRYGSLRDMSIFRGGTKGDFILRSSKEPMPGWKYCYSVTWNNVPQYLFKKSK
jgi:hypothetical protein